MKHDEAEEVVVLARRVSGETPGLRVETLPVRCVWAATGNNGLGGNPGATS